MSDLIFQDISDNQLEKPEGDWRESLRDLVHMAHSAFSPLKPHWRWVLTLAQRLELAEAELEEQKTIANKAKSLQMENGRYKKQVERLQAELTEARK